MKNSERKNNEILEKIESEKEILKTLPQNNKKNIAKYLEKLTELKEQYEKLLEKIQKEINKRYKKATDLQSNNEIEILDAKLKRIEKIIRILNEYQTSYEKMGLDKIIYKIDKYYKGNLEDINAQIDRAMEAFKNVGIELKLTDFNYSSFVMQYMETFFKEEKDEEIRTNKIKEKFEEVYWKCSDIIIHIELNFRNIYLKNKNSIDKYYEKEKNSILKQYEKNKKEIIELYFELEKQRIKKYRKDSKILLNKFIDGKLDIKNFEHEKIQSNYEKIINKNNEEISSFRDMQKGIFEFLNSLYEYKNYLKFEFIIEDIRKIYREKDKYKNSYKEAQKKVEALEKKFKKLNKKSSKRGIFIKKNNEKKYTAEQKQMIAEIRSAYKEMDLQKFYNRIYIELKDDSTIYETLELANSYYSYLTKCIIEENNTITPEKIDEQINELDRFLKNPYNNIISNLTILEEENIAIVIKDRYKLLDFNIEKEDLSEKNIDKLISVLESLVIDYNLEQANLKIQDIEETIELKQALNI